MKIGQTVKLKNFLSLSVLILEIDYAKKIILGLNPWNKKQLYKFDNIDGGRHEQTQRTHIN